ncbi:MAG: phosphoribosylformylglycinamidine synthase subunit PurS [Thermoplasmata archaeon]
MDVPAVRSYITIEVRVALKPGVIDAEAENVEKSLALLGIEPAPHVRTARIFELNFEGVSAETAESRAREAVERLLANPVVHQVSLRRLTP